MSYRQKQITKLKISINSCEACKDSCEIIDTETININQSYCELKVVGFPYYTNKISISDIVLGVRESDDNYEFESIIRRGGHSSYQLVVDGVSEECIMFLNKLTNLGCRFESKKKCTGCLEVIISVDVPPEADQAQVYDVLSDGEWSNVWFLNEGHLSQKMAEAAHAGRTIPSEVTEIGRIDAQRLANIISALGIGDWERFRSLFDAPSRNEDAMREDFYNTAAKIDIELVDVSEQAAVWSSGKTSRITLYFPNKNSNGQDIQMTIITFEKDGERMFEFETLFEPPIW